MSTTKLQAWRDAELHQLASALHEAMLGWRRDWGLAADPGGRVDCAPADDCGQEEWQPLGAHAAPGAWVHWSDVARSELQSLFGASAVCTALTAESATECGRDAARRLAQALQLEPGADSDGQPQIACGKWSGAVLATLACGSRVLVAAACLQRVLRTSACSTRPPRPALPLLSPLLEAASGCEARIEARLADCELDLATLRRLQIGDVVRLPHPLARPLGVRAPGDAPVFDGFLARSGAYRALELVPAQRDA